MIRVVDIALAGAGLFFLAPLLAAVTFAVRLDSAGPVLCRQPLMGRDGQALAALTFRTTRSREGHGARSALLADAHVTRVGRALQLSGLDRLPQLVQVLMGQMSLVGQGSRQA